ncbi:MAG: MFS transporter [Leptolyngbyaceae cyanobacterium CSU_1_4]|nr:MFS transporter [Leptolyngbyaceae cyanobacterium CSU_1_4]
MTITSSDTYVSRPTLWFSLCALASVSGLFTVSWMIYRVHLPGLLTQAGWAPSIAPTLLLIEALIAIALEPLAGLFSDRLHRTKGTRFSLILFGAVLSVLLFIAIPLLAQVPLGGMKGLMLAVLISWAIATTLFRSPALALLRRYAPALRLPQAASVLTFAAGLAGSATPLASEWVKNIGAVPAFALGAILLLLSVLWLQKQEQWSPNPENGDPFESHSARSSLPVSPLHLGAIFGLGVTTALSLRLAVELLPKVLKAQVPGVTPPTFVGILFITLAIAAFPAGRFAVHKGNSLTLILGIIAAAIGFGFMGLIQNAGMAVLLAIELGIALSLLINSTLPWTLGLIPAPFTGLGIGLFFGGGAAATSLFIGWLSPKLLSPVNGMAIAWITLIGAAFCVMAGQEQAPKS